jgi:hypothetical protein
MNRLQISLNEDQYDFLRSEAFVSGQSMAALLRDLLDEAIQRRRDEILQNDPIWQAIGVAQEIEGPTNVSANVDRYLYGEPVAIVGSQPLRKVAEAPDEYLTD